MKTQIRPRNFGAFACAIVLVELIALACIASTAARRIHGATTAAAPASTAPELARARAADGAVARLARLDGDAVERALPMFGKFVPPAPAKTPAGTGSADDPTGHVATLVLRSSLHGLAVIDGAFVRRGETLNDGSRVQAIDPGRVSLILPTGDISTLSVKNDFERSGARKGDR